MALERLIERYNTALKGQEQQTIGVINRTLNESFRSILRRLDVAISKGAVSSSAHEVAVARELGSLLPAVAPDEVDAYEQEFRRLLREATKLGSNYAQDLLRQASSAPGVQTAFVLPIEAAVAAARESRRYLQRHGEAFAAEGAELVARGVLEGRSNGEIARGLRERLGVVSSRAEVIARTESLRSYGVARDERFKAAGTTWVRFWATVDDRTCPVCRPRAGLLYPLGQVQTPVHPQCRCTTTPWRQEIAEMDPDYVEAVESHRQQVLESGRPPATVLNRGQIVGAGA